MEQFERCTTGGIEDLVGNSLKDNKAIVPGVGTQYLGKVTIRKSLGSVPELIIEYENNKHRKTERVRCEELNLSTSESEFEEVIKEYIVKNKLLFTNMKYVPPKWWGLRPQGFTGELYQETLRYSAPGSGSIFTISEAFEKTLSELGASESFEKRQSEL